MEYTTSQHPFTEEIKGTVSEIIRQVKKIIKKGNARRIIIADTNGKILFQSQLTIGVAGTTLITAVAPIVSAISLFAVMMNNVKVIVERYPEEGNKDKTDEYEVDAEVIEIRDEKAEAPDSAETTQTDKTVGKDDE